MIRSTFAAALLALSVFTLGAASPALALDEVNVSTGGTIAGPGLAAHGHDVVAYFRGDGPTLGTDTYAVAYKGAAYRFADQANLDVFKADPEKYVPAFGGFCAYGVAVGKKFDGDPRYWKIVNGRLYLNLNADIAAKWNEDVPGHIAKADGNWTKIRAVAAAKL
jgi:YHS domain